MAFTGKHSARDLTTELAQSQAQAKVGTEALAQANKRPGQLVNLLT